MPTEIELKLAASPRALADAARLPWLRKLANGPVEHKKLVSVYFDTAKFKLRDNRLTLRVRKAGRERLQTVKLNSAAVATGRKEWEAKIASQAPDFKLAKRTPLRRLITRKLKKSLKPVFETDVDRTVMPVRIRNSSVELAFDRGVIKTGARRLPISEIELELKSGEPADIAHLARRLANSVPVTYGAQAKSERGYALVAGTAEEPVDAAPIFLDRGLSAGAAFSLIGLACLHQIAANEAAVRKGKSEGVHQMRVGLRRLRAAISLFGRVVHGQETNDIKRELKWLTEQLGPARDLDVLVSESVEPLRETVAQKREIGLLEAELKAKRDAGFDRARAAVESARCRELTLQAALWLINGKWLRAKGALITARRDQRAVDFASDVLRQRTRKIVKRIGKLKRLSARQRHKLRIAVKKLRYATGFFESLFASAKATKTRKKFEKTLKAMQEALGALNDIAVHEKLASRYAHAKAPAKKRPEKAFAIGILTGREQGEARAHVATAAAAGRKLARARPFW